VSEPPREPQQEHRKYPRSKIAVQVELKTENATVASRTETSDLSVGGCYIEMSFTFELGTELDLVLWIADERIATRVIVVTHHPQFGNGMQFLNLSVEDQDRIDRFLKSCETSPEEKTRG
jgi:c-di-GMP-binding flagellar brake protein YcgR